MGNSVYLIDYENVSYKGLYGISEINREDEVIIFYSNDISIIQDILSVYLKQGITLKYFQLDKTGKNALDFMISAYAGYAASKENITRIAVLSNDKGYASIETIIKAVNSDIELVFENCIYNVIHPDDIKDIVFPAQTEEKTKVKEANTIQELPVINNPVVIEKSDIVKNYTSDFVKGVLDKNTNIPSKYKSSIAGIIAKSLKKGETESKVTSAISKALGSKSANAPYKKAAIDCFNKLKSV